MKHESGYAYNGSIATEPSLEISVFAHNILKYIGMDNIDRHVDEQG